MSRVVAARHWKSSANVRVQAQEQLPAEPQILAYPEDSSSSFYHWTKRIMDIVLSSVLLMAFMPVFVVMAVMIKLDSPGSVLFVQERVGSVRRSTFSGSVWELCTFKLYKFRSMAQDADPSLHERHIQAYVAGTLQYAADPISSFKLTTDPRITRVGRFIRRTSLDELPQLFNVLKGDMSLVGPRPVPGYEVAAYAEAHYERLAAKPGMTGLWQVNGRSAVSFEGMVDLDREYLRRQSLFMDAYILLLTIPAVLSGRDTN